MSLGVISRFLTRNSEYRSGVQLDNGELETMCDPQLVVDVVLNPLIKQHARLYVEAVQLIVTQRSFASL